MKITKKEETKESAASRTYENKGKLFVLFRENGVILLDTQKERCYY